MKTLHRKLVDSIPVRNRNSQNFRYQFICIVLISRLSDGFTKLISLRELYMNDCFFDFLPASFGRMSQLKVLELRDNQLQNLPKSMRRLSQLSRLDLGGNAIELWVSCRYAFGNLDCYDVYF